MDFLFHSMSAALPATNHLQWSADFKRFSQFVQDCPDHVAVHKQMHSFRWLYCFIFIVITPALRQQLRRQGVWLQGALWKLVPTFTLLSLMAYEQGKVTKYIALVQQTRLNILPVLIREPYTNYRINNTRGLLHYAPRFDKKNSHQTKKTPQKSSIFLMPNRCHI
jgi:hypothetical protein